MQSCPLKMRHNKCLIKQVIVPFKDGNYGCYIHFVNSHKLARELNQLDGRKT